LIFRQGLETTGWDLVIKYSRLIQSLTGSLENIAGFWIWFYGQFGRMLGNNGGKMFFDNSGKD
jgi:hypothetical protein